MKVLVSDSIPDDVVKAMQQEGLSVDVNTGLSQEELISIIPEYDALVVRSGTQVTEEVINAAKNLRFIGRAGVGVDNIDVNAATQQGIIVANAPGGNTVSAAEQTLALLFALARDIPQAVQSVKEGKWERKKFLGTELRGKTLGVIGLGRIGFEVARRAAAMEMNVIGYDPYISKERAEDIGVKLAKLDEVIKKSDIITVHVPKTKETTHLLSKEKFDSMKDGVMILNCARGGIIDEEALYKALENGKVKGAALDVYEQEPPEPDNPLFKLDNVVTTPHLGASTKEAQMGVGLSIANELANFSKGLPVKNAINLPRVDSAEFEYLKPYLTLAQKMGTIASARLGGVFTSVKLTFRGSLAKRKTEYISRSLLAGLFSQIVTDINLVSSMQVAEERGVSIEESKSERSGVYDSLLEITVENQNQSTYISGVCFTKEDYRILKIDKYEVDFVPEGEYVISLHEDKPGVIGRIGRLFGEYNVNIAQMIVGRHGGQGGIQLMLLMVDDTPSEELLREMVKVENIINAVYVSL